MEDGKRVHSPEFTFWSGNSDSLADDRLIDVFETTMGKTYQAFKLCESERTTVNGIKTLAAAFDFVRPSGNWSCWLTVRVKGNRCWHLDVSGSTEDVTYDRGNYLSVLANVRLYDSVNDFERAVRDREAARREHRRELANDFGLAPEDIGENGVTEDQVRQFLTKNNARRRPH